MTGASTKLILLVILIVTLLVPIIAKAYVDTTVSHIDVLRGSGDYYVCRVCHQGFPNTGTVASNVIFESYRCMACHYNLDTTHYLTYYTMNSTHRVLLCTSCHDVTHTGHTKQGGYYRVDPTTDRYGCYGGRCHQVVSDRLDPPYSQSFTTWTYTFYSNQTGSINWGLDRKLWVVSINNYYDVFTKVFIDPYTGDLNTPTQERLYESCLKCHFTSPDYTGATTNNYNINHIDVCYECHSWNLTNVDYNMAPHSIEQTRDGNVYCTRCHSGIGTSLSSSVHSSLNCSLCHSTLHISGFNHTASWLIIYYPEQGPILIPSLQQVLDGRRVLYYTPDNASLYSIPVQPISRGTSYTLVTPIYTLRGDASIIMSTSKNITCFNCHFVGWTDPVVGAEELGWKLEGISDPHRITESIIEETPVEQKDTANNLLAVIIAVVAVVATIALSSKVMTNAKNPNSNTS